MILFIYIFFRVSPTEEDIDGGNQRKDRRGKSAQMRRRADASPPDPLEPWSTRDLANINQLLDS